MYGMHRKGKIKNDKIRWWKLNTSFLRFGIGYRPGREDLAADAVSRNFCWVSYTPNLQTMHETLYGLRITRLRHFVLSRYFPFSIEDVKAVTNHYDNQNTAQPSSLQQPHLSHTTFRTIGY